MDEAKSEKQTNKYTRKSKSLKTSRQCIYSQIIHSTEAKEVLNLPK